MESTWQKLGLVVFVLNKCLSWWRVLYLGHFSDCNFFLRLIDWLFSQEPEDGAAWDQLNPYDKALPHWRIDWLNVTLSIFNEATMTPLFAQFPVRFERAAWHLWRAQPGNKPLNSQGVTFFPFCTLHRYTRSVLVRQRLAGHFPLFAQAYSCSAAASLWNHWTK